MSQMRVTGMYSGIDTESIISELVAVKQTKVDTLKKEQTKLSWTQDAWKSLNKKIYSLYSGTLNTLTYQTNYSKKATTISDSTVASVTTSDTAMDCTQTMKVKSLAKSGYMTGSAMDAATTGTTTMGDLLGEDVFPESGTTTLKIKIGDQESEIGISSTDTVNSIVSKLQGAGVNASFDSANKRLFISSKTSGDVADFDISSAGDELSGKVLSALGLEIKADGTGAIKQDGSDAEIELNGATFKSATNIFEVNGLTITCQEETGDNAVTLTTSQDTSGIYDMIKKFIKEYSELVNEMDKLYNAESSKGYEPLTSEEKEAMTDNEIEEWEKKIKDSLLRRDSTLSTVSTAMKSMMSSGFTVDGVEMHLSDFGVETLSYFESADNEKNAYHINGDADDEKTKSKTNDLMAMISKDPEKVVDFFSQMSKGLYASMTDLMKTTEYSSIYTVYEDKKMKTDYSDYTTKITEAEAALTTYENKWYSKFSAMEVALAKLQSNSSAVTSLLG